MDLVKQSFCVGLVLVLLRCKPFLLRFEEQIWVCGLYTITFAEGLFVFNVLEEQLIGWSRLIGAVWSRSD